MLNAHNIFMIGLSNNLCVYIHANADPIFEYDRTNVLL